MENKSVFLIEMGVLYGALMIWVAREYFKTSRLLDESKAKEANEKAAKASFEKTPPESLAASVSENSAPDGPDPEHTSAP